MNEYSDSLMVYMMSGTNIVLSVSVITKGSRYLSEAFDLRGRDRSCFVMPVAYGLAYFVMQLDWLIHASTSAGAGSLRDMAWLLMEFATLIYMANVMESNIRKRLARFRENDRLARGCEVDDPCAR
jgi:hypothetical protein